MTTKDTASHAAEVPAEPSQEQMANLFDAAVDHIETASSATPFSGDEAVAELEAKREKEAAEEVKEQPRDEAGKFKAKEAADAADATKAKAAADALAAKDPAADVIAKLPADQQEAVRKIVADAHAKAAAAEERAKRHTSQVASYRKKLDEAGAEAARAKQAGDSTAAKKAQEEVTAANAKLDALKKDYPPIAEALEAVRTQTAREVETRIRKEFGTQIAELTKNLQPIVDTHAKGEIAAEEAAIEAKHAGWQKEVEKPQFLDWFKQQPPEVQAMAKGSATAEIRLFDLYRVDYPLETREQIAAREKAETERSAADALAAKRAQQQRDAAGPSGKGTPSPSTTQTNANSTDAMFDAAVAKVAKEFRVA